MAVAKLGKFGWKQPVEFGDVSLDAGWQLSAVKPSTQHIIEDAGYDVVAKGITLGDYCADFVIIVVVVTHGGGVDARVSNALTAAVAFLDMLSDE